MTDAPTGRDAQGLWGRLRRRKVVQWSLAYAAGAWGLAQVVGFFVDAFHWPDAVKQIAAIALVVGSAVAVTLAWYHGDKGEQRVTRSEVVVLGLVLLLGGAALWFRGERDMARQRAEFEKRPKDAPLDLTGTAQATSGN